MRTPGTSDHGLTATSTATAIDVAIYSWPKRKPRRVVLWGARGDDIQAGTEEHLATVQPRPESTFDRHFRYDPYFDHLRTA